MNILDADVSEMSYAGDIGMVEATVTLRVSDALRAAPYRMRVPAFAPADLRLNPAALKAHLIGDALQRHGGRGDVNLAPIDIAARRVQPRQYPAI